MKFSLAGIFTAFFLSFLAITSYHHSKLPVLDQVPNVPGFLVPISTGKERVTSSGNRDASMYTQHVRRKATVDGFWASGRVMKETTHTKGFTTGVVEVYSLSDECVRVCKKVEEVCAAVLDGGHVKSEYCAAYDGGDVRANYEVIADGGNATATSCRAVCAAVLDGGDAMAAYCQVYDANEGAGVVLDGGNADANVCEV
jgi:hypothetical protein